MSRKRTSKIEKPEVDVDPGPQAGVEGRDLDGPPAPPADEQSSEGTFSKVYVISGDQPKDDTHLRLNLVTQARQLGLTVRDIELSSATTTEGARGPVTRLEYTAEVVRTAS